MEAGEIEKIRLIFDQFDTDQSGFIERSEYKSAMDMLGVTVTEANLERTLTLTLTLTGDGGGPRKNPPNDGSECRWKAELQ